MENELYKNLDKLENEELLYKVRNSMLTEEANLIALKILQDRGEQTEKINISELNEVKAYGLASKTEKNLSWNTFVNFILCIFLPIVPAGVLTIGIELTKGMNIVLRSVSSLIMIGIALFIVKVAYIQLFEKKDKLNNAVKVLSFGPTILVTLFFMSASIFDLFK
jgi:hypothetical protein